MVTFFLFTFKRQSTGKLANTEKESEKPGPVGACFPSENITTK